MSILIGNLPSGINESVLRDLFSEYGSCTVLLSFDEAIVSYSYTHEAMIAYHELQGKELEGKTLKLTKMFANNLKNIGKILNKNKPHSKKEQVNPETTTSPLTNKAIQRTCKALGYKAARKSAPLPTQKDKYSQEDNKEDNCKDNLNLKEKTTENAEGLISSEQVSSNSEEH